MPIELLLGSGIAITLLSLAAWRMFPVRSALDVDRVNSNFLRTYPDESVLDLVFSTNQTNAIVKLARSEAIGLVTLMGDRIVCRLIERQDGTEISITQNTLALRLPDFTFPSAALTLTDQDQDKSKQWCGHWLASTREVAAGE